MKINLSDLPKRRFFVGLDKEYNDKLCLKFKEKFSPLYKNCKRVIGISDSKFCSLYKKQQYRLDLLIKLTKILKLDILKDQEHITYIKSGFAETNKIKPGFPIELSPELSRIIAHLFGDGHLNLDKRKLVQCAYYNQNKLLREQFKKDLRTIFNPRKITEGINKTTNFVRVPSSIAWILFQLAGDFSSKGSRIPSFIIKSSNEIKKEFIKAFFDDEAHVRYEPPHRYIEFALSNLFLLKEIKDLLLNFGIESKKIFYKRIREFDSYTFYIKHNHNINNFSKEINFYHPLKKEKMQKILKDPGRKSYGKGETEEKILSLLNKGIKTSTELSKKLQRTRCTINSFLTKLEEKEKVKKSSFKKEGIIWEIKDDRINIL